MPHQLTLVEILDSRGVPTLECHVNGVAAGVPSGLSVGRYEAKEKRDQDLKRYDGRGLVQSIARYQPELQALIADCDLTNQAEIDRRLRAWDPDYTRANFTLGVSLAACRAAAQQQPLYAYIQKLHGRTIRMPRLMVNLINGGVHAGHPEVFQEFMIVPETGRLETDLEQAVGIFHSLKKHYPLVGDEGGVADAGLDIEQSLTILSKYGVPLALDCAAGTLYQDSGYRIEGKWLDPEMYGKWLLDLSKRYPIISIEDPFAEDAWLRLPEGSMLWVGDDQFATNPHRLRQGIDQGIANAILIKPNQIGTLTETLETVRMAQDHGYTVVVSHRSGETNDDFIADLAVGVGAEFVKFGAPNRGERIAKYNRLRAINATLL